MTAVVIAQQHIDDVSEQILRKEIFEKVVYPVCKDYMDNETKIYIGINKLSNEIKITRNIIIKYSLLKKTYKGYNFEVLNTDTDENKIILEKIKSSKKEKIVNTIKVINIATNEETIHKGLTSLCKKMHMNHFTIMKYVNNGESYKGHKFEILSKKSFN